MNFILFHQLDGFRTGCCMYNQFGQHGVVINGHIQAFSVTVVDKGGVGRGGSYGNACLIVPSHSDPIPGPGVITQGLRYLLSSTSPFYIRPRLDPGLAADVGRDVEDAGLWLRSHRRFSARDASTSVTSVKLKPRACSSTAR